MNREAFEIQAKRFGWDLRGQYDEEAGVYDDVALQRLWVGFQWCMNSTNFGFVSLKEKTDHDAELAAYKSAAYDLKAAADSYVATLEEQNNSLREIITMLQRQEKETPF